MGWTEKLVQLQVVGTFGAVNLPFLFAILDGVKISSLELLTEQLGMKSSYSKWTELSSFSLWYSFLGCFITEVSGVSSCNDSSEALYSVSLVLDSLEVSVLSAGGI